MSTAAAAAADQDRGGPENQPPLPRPRETSAFERQQWSQEKKDILFHPIERETCLSVQHLKK